MDSSTREAASEYDFKWYFYHYFSIATWLPGFITFFPSAVFTASMPLPHSPVNILILTPTAVK